ncbi:type IX secretion/gliding motility protein PorT/SprT [Flectobacillus roseus]|uniref:Porin family protein n=1 Tax=Flectobacillus roseus TaxID=502259 RepID=A0ABT6Y4Z7_9BACT|nr:porin family protein [Flectobacillus roseus]MDI9858586.1 porin family protein [Flectobacillus roseus]
MLTTYVRNKYDLHWQKIIFAAVTGILVLGFSQKSQAQRYKYKRIYDEFYDEKLVHFGFLFGFGDARFNLYHGPQVASTSDTSRSIVSPGNFAFLVGGIANFTLSKHFDLKTGINIALYGREIDYRFNNSPNYPPELRESTWLEIPVLLKLKSQRRGNSRMFVDAGFKLGLEANVRKNAATTTRLNTKTGDFSIEYGIGFEQFFKYFKFTPELRFSHGLVNMYVAPTNPFSYSNAIQKLNSHSVTLYLMFE